MKLLAQTGKVKFKYLCVVEEVEITKKILTNTSQRISGKAQQLGASVQFS